MTAKESSWVFFSAVWLVPNNRIPKVSFFYLILMVPVPFRSSVLDLRALSCLAMVFCRLSFSFYLIEGLINSLIFLFCSSYLWTWVILLSLTMLPWRSKTSREQFFSMASMTFCQPSWSLSSILQTLNSKLLICVFEEIALIIVLKPSVPTLRLALKLIFLILLSVVSNEAKWLQPSLVISL